MNLSDIFFPKDDTFRLISRVIPQLINIINENQIDIKFEINELLEREYFNETFSLYDNQKNSSYAFKLKEYNTKSLCYYFLFSNSNDQFSIEVTFNSDFPNGMIQLDYTSLNQPSVVVKKLLEMIKFYSDYQKFKYNCHLHLEKSDYIATAHISNEGLNFSEASGKSRFDSGGGFSYTLEEFVHEGKGQNEIRTNFSDKDLSNLILSAKIRLKYPYLFV